LAHTSAYFNDITFIGVTYDNAIGKARRIVARYRRALMKAALIRQCSIHQVKHRQLLIDMKVRWNSTKIPHNLIASKQRPALTKAVLHSEGRENR